MTSARRGDDGSATVWVLATAVLVFVIGSVVTLRTYAVLARHHAESAADLAALAGAARIGVDGAYCAAAARVASLNHVRLQSCAADVAAGARVGTVTVSVAATVTLPFLGRQAVVARARAGREPP